MRVLIALGGNALLRPEEALSAKAQQRNAEQAAQVIAEIARDHEVIVTHGNGPQIGLLASRSEIRRDTAAESPEQDAARDRSGAPPEPTGLDVLGAESEGWIGHLLGLALRNAAPSREIVSLLTQVEVDPLDPGFADPTKPIGRVLSQPPGSSALPMRRERSYARDRGGWRRVVASPEPRRILELVTIERLVSAGVLVVCAGGGGIPVCRNRSGRLEGAEAVIDKDLTSALLAASLGCERLLLLTDVENVYLDWPEATHPIRETPPDPLRRLLLDPGSMAPKVEAACRFVDSTEGTAAIGRLEDGVAVLRGERGTQITTVLHT
jgi:carbamate kinase